MGHGVRRATEGGQGGARLDLLERLLRLGALPSSPVVLEPFLPYGHELLQVDRWRRIGREVVEHEKRVLPVVRLVALLLTRVVVHPAPANAVRGPSELLPRPHVLA